MSLTIPSRMRPLRPPELPAVAWVGPVAHASRNSATDGAVIVSPRPLPSSVVRTGFAAPSVMPTSAPCKLELFAIVECYKFYMIVDVPAWRAAEIILNAIHIKMTAITLVANSLGG